jgi:hypothetical protein
MSAGADDLDGALAGLYRRPLGEFVAARDRLAHELRAAGEREAAQRVAGLSWTSDGLATAWAARHHPCPTLVARVGNAPGSSMAG